jgi:hypothetical protein
LISVGSILPPNSAGLMPLDFLALALPRMNLGTLYLVMAAALIFGACLFAAKKAYPNLQAREFALIAVITVVTVGFIWMLLGVANKGHENSPANQPGPLLQPSQD